MRAKLLNEKFIEETDPIEDMGIGVPEMRELRKNYTELEKYIDFDVEDLNFNEVIITLNNLTKIIPYTIVFYFNQKYKLNIKLDKHVFGGNVIAKCRISGYELWFNWSNSGASADIEFFKNGLEGHSAQCRSLRALETSFLKVCAKLNILIKQY